jgi:hypothetical protein
MAYINPQLQLDQQQQQRADNNYQSIGNAVSGVFQGMKEDRIRALANKERMNQEDLAYSVQGHSSDSIKKMRETGDTSDIMNRNSEIATAARARSAEEADLNRRSKEAQIIKDLREAGGKRDPLADYEKKLSIKQDHDNKNLKLGKNAVEFDSRMANILGETEQLKSMVNQNGTYEAFGPHNASLAQKIDSIAIDAAKLFDPESVARESEVAAFRKMLFEPGTLSTSNNTALGTVDGFKKLIQDRAARSRGEEVIGDKKEKAPPIDPVILKKIQAYTPEQAEARKKDLMQRKAASQGGV